MDEFEESTRGGDPTDLGVCTRCGRVYTLQRIGDREFRPVGTDGNCRCGHHGFHPISAGDETPVRGDRAGED
jgi:hypothetical protein